MSVNSKWTPLAFATWIGYNDRATYAKWGGYKLDPQAWTLDDIPGPTEQVWLQDAKPVAQYSTDHPDEALKEIYALGLTESANQAQSGFNSATAQPIFGLMGYPDTGWLYSGAAGGNDVDQLLASGQSAGYSLGFMLKAVNMLLASYGASGGVVNPWLKDANGYLFVLQEPNQWIDTHDGSIWQGGAPPDQALDAVTDRIGGENVSVPLTAADIVAGDKLYMPFLSYNELRLNGPYCSISFASQVNTAISVRFGGQGGPVLSQIAPANYSQGKANPNMSEADPAAAWLNRFNSCPSLGQVLTQKAYTASQQNGILYGLKDMVAAIPIPPTTKIALSTSSYYNPLGFPRYLQMFILMMLQGQNPIGLVGQPDIAQVPSGLDEVQPSLLGLNNAMDQNTLTCFAAAVGMSKIFDLNDVLDIRNYDPARGSGTVNNGGAPGMTPLNDLPTQPVDVTPIDQRSGSLFGALLNHNKNTDGSTNFVSLPLNSDWHDLPDAESRGLCTKNQGASLFHYGFLCDPVARAAVITAPIPAVVASLRANKSFAWCMDAWIASPLAQTPAVAYLSKVK